MSIAAAVREASLRIAPYLSRTPLEHSVAFSREVGAEVYFKLENLQRTGSFKARGALNKVLSLSEAQKARGVVSASSGNHGAAVAFALGTCGGEATVFVPHNGSRAKVQNIERLGARVAFHGTDSGQTEVFARRYAPERDLTFISPYNDPDVIAGQGTIGLELLEILPDLDVVFVAPGGGGLLGGIASYLKKHRPGVEIIGASPAHSQVMIQSVKAGRILDLPSKPTLSDGTAGGVEPGAITFDLIREHVDGFATIDEGSIAAAMRDFISFHHLLLEGAAGVAIAAMRQQARTLRGKRVAVVICGANIGLDVLKSIL